LFAAGFAPKIRFLVTIALSTTATFDLQIIQIKQKEQFETKLFISTKIQESSPTFAHQHRQK